MYVRTHKHFFLSAYSYEKEIVVYLSCVLSPRVKWSCASFSLLYCFRNLPNYCCMIITVFSLVYFVRFTQEIELMFTQCSSGMLSWRLINRCEENGIDTHEKSEIHRYISTHTHTYIYIHTYIQVVRYQSQCFKLSKAGLNSKFSFSSVCYTKAKELTLPYYLLIVGENPPPWGRCDTRSMLKRSKAGLKFFFLKIGCNTKFKEPNLSYYLPIAIVGGKPMNSCLLQVR